MLMRHLLLTVLTWRITPECTSPSAKERSTVDHPSRSWFHGSRAGRNFRQAPSDHLVQAFFETQGHPAMPAHIWEDNMSTICLAKTGRSCSERSRHIEIRFFWIRDFLTTRQITLEHLHTDKIVADMFTKPLQGSKFKTFRFSCLNGNWFFAWFYYELTTKKKLKLQLYIYALFMHGTRYFLHFTTIYLSTQHISFSS